MYGSQTHNTVLPWLLSRTHLRSPSRAVSQVPGAPALRSLGCSPPMPRGRQLYRERASLPVASHVLKCRRTAGQLNATHWVHQTSKRVEAAVQLTRLCVQRTTTGRQTFWAQKSGRARFPLTNTASPYRVVADPEQFLDDLFHACPLPSTSSSLWILMHPEQARRVKTSH